MLYLDHAATTMTRPEVREVMAPHLGAEFGNPSGIHAVSRKAKNAVEAAMEQAADLIGAGRPLEIVFTGGGTESDNLAVAGSVLAGGRRGGVVTTAIEHSAVLETARFLKGLGCPVEIVGVDASGRVDPAAIASAVDSRTVVVSVMAGNNETGCIQPVREIAAAVRALNSEVAVHTDAVQAFISEEITVATTGADLITLASHKLGGPQGVGVLYVRDRIELEPVIHGGGQELDRRSGTHNVAGIVGMVKAMELTVADREAFRARVGSARDNFEAALRARFPDITVNAAENRLVQHAHLRIPGVSAETLLIRLDQAGIAAAAGSACHSGAINSSHVLEAMDLSKEEAAECVRFSFGWMHGAGDGTVAAQRVLAILEELR